MEEYISQLERIAALQKSNDLTKDQARGMKEKVLRDAGIQTEIEDPEQEDEYVDTEEGQFSHCLAFLPPIPTHLFSKVHLIPLLASHGSSTITMGKEVVRSTSSMPPRSTFTKISMVSITQHIFLTSLMNVREESESNQTSSATA